MSEISRNALCPCGSGEKYKKCCLAKDEAQRKPRRDEDALLVLQPTRGTLCYEAMLSLDMNACVQARRTLRIARKPVDIARHELAKHALEAIERGDLFDFTPRETFILWLDDDAWIAPGLLPTMMRCMHEYQALDALFGWFCTRTTHAPPVALRRFDDGNSVPRINVDCRDGDIVPIEAAGFHAVMMRPRLLERIGPDPFTPNPAYQEGEDWAFCRRAKSIGAKMAVGTGFPVAHVDPRDGVCYLPGEAALLCDGPELRRLDNTHAAPDGTVKSGEFRTYGPNCASHSAQSAHQTQLAALRAEIENRRKITEGAA